MLNPQQAQALEAAEGQSASPKAIERLAKGFGADIARWAFEQWDLRRRGRTKFPDSWKHMLFQREALEQATHQSVASYRASRFPEDVLVADLTCSIGADLIALAMRGPAIGVDLDALRLKLAAHNLSVSGAAAGLVAADCLSINWCFDYAFADPARRVGGRRTSSPDAFQPNPAALAKRMSRLRLAAMKLSPMIADSQLLDLGDSLEFWSFGREAREAVLWFGSDRRPGVWAIHVESGAALMRASPPPIISEPAEWVFEADPAAIRANALGALCSGCGLTALGNSNGYLTGSERVDNPFLMPLRVLRSCRYDVKSLQSTLRELGAARPTVKSRVPDFDASSFAMQFRPFGARPLVIVLFPVGRSIRALIAENP